MDPVCSSLGVSVDAWEGKNTSYIYRGALLHSYSQLTNYLLCEAQIFPWSATTCQYFLQYVCHCSGRFILMSSEWYLLILEICDAYFSTTIVGHFSHRIRPHRLSCSSHEQGCGLLRPCCRRAHLHIPYYHDLDPYCHFHACAQEPCS